MNETLSSLVAEIQSLRETVDSQFAEICQLNRNTERLLKENRELRIRLEKYERPSKDSNNSGTPPAKESIPAQVTRRTKSQRQKSDRPVGGQVGHEGTTRKVVNIPDEIEEVSAHYCRECGRDLSDIKGELDYRRQEVDLPPVAPIYRETRFYKKVCACGCCNTGYAPRKRGGNAVTFGKRVKAIATYLSVVQCVPYERLQSMFDTVFNIKISQGTLANIVKEMLEKSKLRPHEYVSGETLRVLGEPYTLHVLEGKMPKAELRGGELVLTVRPGSTPEQREAVLIEFYRAILTPIAEEYLELWQERTGLRCREWHTKKMKTR